MGAMPYAPFAAQHAPRTSFLLADAGLSPRLLRPASASRPPPATRLRAWCALLCAATLALAGGCAGRPQAPILDQPSGSAAAATPARLDAVLPADVLLLGEQHSAKAHHDIEQQVIAVLATRGLLAAVALEMSDVGLSTAKLQPRATDEQVRRALHWNDKAWPWAAYGPAVMSAVHAGVPVLGANLPAAQIQASMADRKLDTRLPGPALKAQQQSIRIGHCNLLPENQITPMTRVQIARDIAMADTLGQLVLAGKVVVLLTGSGHADHNLGVPQHLPADLRVKAVRLLAADPADPAGNAIVGPLSGFDSVWMTPALPPTDDCAGLKAQLAPHVNDLR